MNDYFDRIELQLVRSVEARAARRRLVARFALRPGLLAPVGAALVVVAVVGVFLGVRGRPTPVSPGSAARGIELVYQASPTPQTPRVTPAALARTIEILRQRADELGIGSPSIRATAAGLITVGLPSVADPKRAVMLLGHTARLKLYDWEANALLPSGRTVASQLPTLDPTAMLISQGDAGTQAGDRGAGSMSLYRAVLLASRQHQKSSTSGSPRRPQYYIFGAPGSAACAASARTNDFIPAIRQHCLLSGPDDSLSDAEAGLPPGVRISQGEVLAVPAGIVVLQAIPSSFSRPPSFYDPSAQFYVLLDRAALFGNEITNPRAGRDQAGNPDVRFDFTQLGQKDFRTLTAGVARRGRSDSAGSATLSQHFAVALDNQLITVPYIDFRQFPDGIDGANGAEIAANFTPASAQNLATQLRLGTLPVGLKLVSERTLPAR